MSLLYPKIVLLIFCLLFLSPSAQSANNVDLLNSNNKISEESSQSLDYKPDNSDGLVILEPLNVVTERKSGQYELRPYKQRRKKWGSSWSIGQSLYSPSFYDPDNSSETFDDLYGSAEQPLIEFQYVRKRNFSFFSLGYELGIGSYKTNSVEGALTASDLSLTMGFIGVTLELDAIMDEPMVAPYVSAGGYVVVYKETQGTTVLNGRTFPAPYYTVGIKFQMNWLEKDAARISYEESGLENTFLFVEARQFLASSAEQDKYFDTETPPLKVGLNIEF